MVERLSRSRVARPRTPGRGAGILGSNHTSFTVADLDREPLLRLRVSAGARCRYGKVVDGPADLLPAVRRLTASRSPAVEPGLLGKHFSPRAGYMFGLPCEVC